MNHTPTSPRMSWLAMAALGILLLGPVSARAEVVSANTVTEPYVPTTPGATSSACNSQVQSAQMAQATYTYNQNNSIITTYITRPGAIMSCLGSLSTIINSIEGVIAALQGPTDWEALVNTIENTVENAVLTKACQMLAGYINSETGQILSTISSVPGGSIVTGTLMGGVQGGVGAATGLIGGATGGVTGGLINSGTFSGIGSSIGTTSSSGSEVWDNVAAGGTSSSSGTSLLGGFYNPFGSSSTGTTGGTTTSTTSTSSGLTGWFNSLFGSSGATSSTTTSGTSGGGWDNQSSQ